MSETLSTMMALGTRAPEFSLPDVVSGRSVSLAKLRGSKALLVGFTCNHCPYANLSEGEFGRIGRVYGPKGVAVVAISSNDAAQYPDDDPAHMRVMAKRAGFDFPYCHDESQETAKAYGAACTPDYFLFDADFRLVYRGQIDDARPGNGRPSDGRSLRAALDAVLAGKPVPADQRPSLGCNIKWKRGSAPAYHRR